MTNRGKYLNNRQPNNNKTTTHTNNTNNNNNKIQVDDDNCSVVCYKDMNDGHVGVVRIRQQPICTACNVMRATLSLYYKHVLENNHRENVKKLCEENRFLPSIYDQAIHLAFHNNFYYQSDKFHFVYKHTNEEAEPVSEQNQTLSHTKAEITIPENFDTQQKSTTLNSRKRRNFQVTLVFQDKKYTQVGTTTAQIREQLLKEMIADRASDIATMPMEIYYVKKKIAPDNVHHNAQKSYVIFNMAKDQLQVTLKKHPQEEPLENGSMSSAKNSNEDTRVEQNTAVTTPKVLKTEETDVDQPPSFVDDVINICKDALNHMVLDIYTKSDEFKREQQFLSGIARRSFKKKNTFFCDICSIFLTSEKYCTQHLIGSDHLEKIRRYKDEFLPWRLAMQESLITGKTMKDIMGSNAYDKYKSIMAQYLAPNSLSHRGRFCCAYCEVVCTDQWALEKHLHTNEHRNKQTLANHKDLVTNFSNIFIIPTVFKFNGITQLSEVPDDIKNRYRWVCTTRAQLDEDTASFLRNYPCDAFEGTTRIVNVKPVRKSKAAAKKSAAHNIRNDNSTLNHQSKNKRGMYNNKRRGSFQGSAINRGLAGTAKRAVSLSGPPSKRFRQDLNNSFPGANRAPEIIRNDMNQYAFHRPASYNMGHGRWQSRHIVAQQRDEFFERSNPTLRALASDNNGYYGVRQPNSISGGNNYHQGQPSHFNDQARRYANQQSNYDPGYIRNTAKTATEYPPGPNNPPTLMGSSQHVHHRAPGGPINEFAQQGLNTLQRPPYQQQLAPTMAPPHFQNQNSLNMFGMNNNNKNANPSYFSSAGSQPMNQMAANVPPPRTYADYRTTTGPSINNSPLTTYAPMMNTQNPIIPQSRPFDEISRSSLPYNSANTSNRVGQSSFVNEEQRLSNFGQQKPAEQAFWHGPSRGSSTNARGRGGQGTHTFQSTHKVAASAFSYSSRNNNINNNNNNNNNNINPSSIRGRGANPNVRSFGNRY